MNPSPQPSAKWLTLLQRLSSHLLPFLFLLIGIPLLTIVGFGLHAIYAQGYALPFFAFITLLTIITGLTWWGIHYSTHQQLQGIQSVDSWVHVASDWNEHDRQLWQQLNEIIEQQLQKNAEWSELRAYAFTLITKASEHYRLQRKHQAFAFSIVELLTMFEEISRRYRLVLQEHIPAVEHIQLSTLHWLYDHRDKYETGKTLWNVYRVIRAFTPTGLLAEARSQVVNQLFGDLSLNIQLSLKRALLQEVAAVAIDLYSGRFKVTEQEVAARDTASETHHLLAPPPEPLKVGLLGQISAGKSSIINALLGSMQAEIGQIPTTASAQIYTAKLGNAEVLHLLDLAGLEGNAEHNKVLLEQLTQCDVVLWVLKANQPARALDLAFKQQWDTWFAKPENISRRPPVVIGVLNQIDRLPPIQEWQPPYDLQQPHSSKAKTIKEALDYNRQLLGFETIIPLVVGQERSYNLGQLQQLLDENYTHGLQVQLNRRRLDAAAQLSWQQQFKRAYRLGQSLFKIATTK